MKAVATLAFVALCACGGPFPHRTTLGAHVLGTPADAKIEDGMHAGFEVRRDCLPSGRLIVIRGSGSRWFEDAEPGSGRRRGAMQSFQKRIKAALAGIQSIHVWGPMVVCDREGAGAMLYDWREVDLSLSIIARILVREDLREQAALLVTGSPVLATDGK